MTITQCITRLQQLFKKHGDVECESDCPYCGRSFPVGVVVVAPTTVRLNQPETTP